MNYDQKLKLSDQAQPTQSSQSLGFGNVLLIISLPFMIIAFIGLAAFSIWQLFS